MHDPDFALALPQHSAWDGFFEHSFRRFPVIFRDALPRPFLDEEALLDTYRNARAGASTNSNVIMYSAAREEDGFRRARGEHAAELLPGDDDDGFQQYCARLERAGITAYAAHLRYCMMAYSDRSYWSARSLLTPFFETSGPPAGTWNLDCYAGMYRNTVFGVHRDLEDQLYMTPLGRKRIMLWAPEAWRSVPEHKDFRYKWADHPIRPQVFEIGPRDILYWPSEWFHIGESTEFAISVQVNLRFKPIIPDYSPVLRTLQNRIEEVMGEDARQFGDDGQAHWPRKVGHLGDFSEVHDELQDCLIGARMRWRSVWFAGRHNHQDALVPQIGPFEPVELRPEDLFVLSRDYPIYWSVLSSGRLIMACNGMQVGIEAEPSLVSLIERLRPGTRWTAAELAALAPAFQTEVYSFVAWLGRAGGIIGGGA